MGRPLTALWRASRNRPLPRGSSLRASHMTRSRPESLTMPIVWLPRPCQDPRGRVTAMVCGGAACGAPPQPLTSGSRAKTILGDTEEFYGDCARAVRAFAGGAMNQYGSIAPRPGA